MILSMLNFSEAAARSVQGWSSIFALMSLIAEQDRYPGAKAVVYFAEGIHVPVDLTQQFRSLIATAKRANVRVYAVDASGLTTTDRGAAAKAELEQALQSAAEEMGPGTTERRHARTRQGP